MIFVKKSRGDPENGFKLSEGDSVNSHIRPDTGQMEYLVIGVII
jgi:hypothetical protein